MSVTETSFSEPNSLVVDSPVTSSQFQQNPITAPASGEGISLRSECISPTNGSAKSWKQITERFESYLESVTNARPVFRTDSGETFVGQNNHRFSASYASRQYRKVMQGERDLLRSYSNPHTVLLTLTAPIRDTERRAHRPIDRHLSLKDGYPSVRSKLRYELKEKRSLPYEYIAVHGPTRRGKAMGHDHIHIGLWVDGKVSTETFEPVIDKHVDKCALATADLHPYEKAIQTQPASVTEPTEYELENDLSPTTELGGYVLGHLPGTGMEADVRENSIQFRRHSAIMWATGNRSFVTSQGFPSLADTNSAGGCEHVGIQVGGEIYETDSGSTRPDMMVTKTPAEEPPVITSKNPNSPV